jgi:hypothetical protein
VLASPKTPNFHTPKRSNTLDDTYWEPETKV